MKKTIFHFFFIAILFCHAPGRAQKAVYLDNDAPLEERINDALSHMTLNEKIAVLHAQSKFTSAGVPRLGIRQLNMDDGPHGVREELEWNSWSVARWTNDSIVAFPSLSCLAATWNRDMATLYGNAISEEFAFRGKDVLLGPGVNIARTPLNGRAFEYMGEDPYLAGEMAVRYIRGVQANGVACCLKHFVLNDQETDRFGVNVNVDERALREIYLRPFEKAVKEAGVWSIMGSYNYWQNIHCCHNDALLNGILKGEWGWDGALVSDWGGATNTLQAATGGLDIEMGSYTDGKLKESEYTYDDFYLARPFRQMIKDGTLPMSTLDEKVRRVLRLIFRTSMNPHKVVGNQCSEAHFDACRRIAEEGIVLLRNEKVKDGKVSKPILPLDASSLAGKRILVVGENATRSLTKGGGSSELKSLRDISPLEGLRAVFGEDVRYVAGYVSGRAIYDKVEPVDPALEQRLHDEAVAAASNADLVIFVGGLNKNHRQDCENGDRENYNLPFGQNRLISDLAAKQPRIIVCIFGGNPYATPWLQDIAALVHCWYLGSESGTALANVLTGRVNPSGRLPITFAHRLQDFPSMRFGKEGYPGITNVAVPANSAGEVPHRQVYYKEGIFVGYRWFESAGKGATLYPFGYGLSYTTFEYGKPTVTTTADGWDIALPITNTGRREGKETVQLYTGRKGKSDIERPAKELRNFTKVNLKAGETKKVSLHLKRDDLRYWDEASHCWTLEPGEYIAYVCASAADVRQHTSLSVEPSTSAIGDTFPRPTHQQLAWQQMEQYAFLHFSINTFTNQEWGFGNEPATLFNPQKLDAGQWARTCKAAGLKGIILTAKHHCGFCLWPTSTTEYSVKNSSWRDGKGDVVRELADACRKEGLKFAVYVSPWDRNAASYGSKDYITMFREQLHELLTQYGDIFEVWFDGANGGTGWYGGASSRREIDRHSYYDWEETYRLVRQWQPNCVIWNDEGQRGDLRWVGNEAGYAGQPNWSMLNSEGDVSRKQLNHGVETGDRWVPAEVDTSIRPGWFWHERENNQVKTLARLMDIYYKSVGRNAALLLNFPITPEGLIDRPDSITAVAFGKYIKQLYAHNLAKEGKTQTKGNTTTLTLKRPTTVNRILLGERIEQGQRVKAFRLEAEIGGKWVELKDELLPEGEALTTIGYKRIICFPTISSRRFRLTVTDSKDVPLLREFSLYLAPPIVEPIESKGQS